MKVWQPLATAPLRTYLYVFVFDLFSPILDRIANLVHKKEFYRAIRKTEEAITPATPPMRK